MERPLTWDDFIGQQALKDTLKIRVASAVEREVRMDHILLVGPPGCGKTTLAGILQKEVRTPPRSYVMPLSSSGLKRLIMEERGMVLLDEFHRCTPKEQENFLSVIEDHYFQLPNGERLPTNEMFSVIAATTEPDKVIKPLYDRFKIRPVYEEYTDGDLATIVKGMGKKVDLDFSTEMATMLGRAAGGVPRNAEALVTLTLDLHTVQGKMPAVKEILTRMNITEDGLNNDQVKYLEVLGKSGGVAGLDLLATHLRLPKPLLLDHERLLVKLGYIQYSKQGRELIRKGWEKVREYESH